MDEWRVQSHRMASGGIGPVLSYHHSMRARSSPYPMTDLKASAQIPPPPASYPYPSPSTSTTNNPLSPPSSVATMATTPNPTNASSTPIPVSNETTENTSSSLDDISNIPPTSDVYSPNSNPMNYPQPSMEVQGQNPTQHMMPVKSAAGPMVGYHPGQQQIMTARARSMPYQMPPPPSSSSSHPHAHHPHAHHPHQHSHQHQHQHQHQHPSMYSHPGGSMCQCTSHMQQPYPMHPSAHPMYYQQQQQQQQQQSEAWYRYQQQQQQQAAWRQHQMQQHQQQQQQQQQQHHHLPPSNHQPVSLEQSYHSMLADNTSTAKSKATKAKTKKKQASMPLINDESSLKYQPIAPNQLPMQMRMQQGVPPSLPSAQSARVCMPPNHHGTAAYYPAVYPTSTPYAASAQQLPPQSLSTTASIAPTDHPSYAQTSPTTLSHHQSQIFTSPSSNPGTPHQMHSNGEFNNAAEFGVPYHHGAPGSVNSLTDALCPSGGSDSSDRQMTPGPPSVGTPRVAPHQYSFPHTPLTPQTISNQSTNPHTPVMLPPTPNPLSAPPTPLTRPRSSSEQIHSIQTPYQQYEQTKPINNVDDLAAYLKDPTNVYLPDDVTSNLFEDIDALADTYLGQQATSQQSSHVDNNSAEAILLSFLLPDDVTS